MAHYFTIKKTILKKKHVSSCNALSARSIHRILLLPDAYSSLAPERQIDRQNQHTVMPHEVYTPPFAMVGHMLYLSGTLCRPNAQISGKIGIDVRQMNVKMRVTTSADLRDHVLIVERSTVEIPLGQLCKQVEHDAFSRIRVAVASTKTKMVCHTENASAECISEKRRGTCHPRKFLRSLIWAPNKR